MIKSYKIRLYPDKKQEELMWKHVGCCRFIWNWMLAYQQEQYKLCNKQLSAFDMMRLLPMLKKEEEYKWLRDVSYTALQIVCRDLDKAYASFFRKQGGFPNFKSRKRATPNFPCRCNSVYFNNGVVNIEKVGKIRYKTDYDFPQGKGFKFTNPRISYDSGKWMLSFGIECENQTPILTDKSMGIDVGIKEQAVVAFGDEQIVFHNINKSRRMKDLEKRIKHLQRTISRKYKANKQGKKFIKTKNIEKCEDKLRRMKRHQSNIRHNYIHQTTHALVSMLPYRVVMEDLNVQGMMKNHHLAKAIAEQNFYEFIRQMQYKCEWSGIEFIQADRKYPSSKACSYCGTIKSDLKLKDRVFKCECGCEIDRDFNAALNLSRYVAKNT